MNIPGSTQSGIWKLWSWLRGAPSSVARDGDDCQPFPAPGPAFDRARVDAASALRPVTPALARDPGENSAVVLAFPLRGEALLVKLAELLRNRVADRGPERDPMLLTMSRCPGSRLSIDRDAYVEFDADRSSYRLAIEAAPDTIVTLDTTDFDTVVNFVVRYIAERLSRPATLEAAS